MVDVTASIVSSESERGAAATLKAENRANEQVARSFIVERKVETRCV